MIILHGTRKEIAQAVKGISNAYPTALIEHLSPGEWHFMLNGVDTLVYIEEES